MAVLKRFSYDNIVEHNPTAPDPVEGGGGSGGETTPRIIVGGSITVFYDGSLTAGQTSLSLDSNAEPMKNPDPSNYISLTILTSIEYGTLKEYFNGYSIKGTMDDTPNGLVVELSDVSSNIQNLAYPFRAIGFVLYIYMGE